MASGSWAARMRAHLKHEWQVFRRLPKGRRFQIHHQDEQRKNRARPTWLRVLRVLFIPLSIAIGIVLTFIPGPAILFFFFAAALLAAHSMAVARALDRMELALRAAWRKFLSWKRAQGRKPKAPLPRPRASH